jgi:hypothetical protein
VDGAATTTVIAGDEATRNSVLGTRNSLLGGDYTGVIVPSPDGLTGFGALYTISRRLKETT